MDLCSLMDLLPVRKNMEGEEEEQMFWEKK
jgi:hypothetical protein